MPLTVYKIVRGATGEWEKIESLCVLGFGFKICKVESLDVSNFPNHLKCCVLSHSSLRLIGYYNCVIMSFVIQIH